MLTSLLRFANTTGRRGETKMGLPHRLTVRSLASTFIDLADKQALNNFGLPDVDTLIRDEILLDFHRAHAAELSK